MILGRTEEAMQKHAEAARLEMDPWQALSIQEQAFAPRFVRLDAEELQRLSDLYEGRVP